MPRKPGKRMHKITEILPGSIAKEVGISAGDFLLRINEKEILDVIDYRFAVSEEEFLLEIQKADGEIWEIEIEKDASEDMGIIFDRPLMSETRRCHNKCIFCFIDQQPPGLRDSLYVKDDDVRLSFLHGNYVTLTNLSDAEIRRIAGYHLSPLKISVHTTDLALRKIMLRNKNAGNLFKTLAIFGDAGIKMHFQAVICKGINDGVRVEDTIFDLHLLKGAESLAIVPAGITRHRKGIHRLKQFTAREAKKILDSVHWWQENCREDMGTNFVFAADEWYIMAEEPLPPYEAYEDFPQLDNGVGMLRLFEREFNTAADNPTQEAGQQPVQIAIITGQAAAKFMRSLADTFEKKRPGAKITVHAVKNNFFGKNITVSGLLTGADIIAQLKGSITADVIFLPQNAFRADTETMLDGTTRTDLSAALSVPVQIGSPNGHEFFQQLRNSS